MPNVNGKKFPYTPAGMKAAKDYAKKNPIMTTLPANKKSKSPKINPIMTTLPSNKKSKSPKINPIMTTLPSRSSKTKKM